MPRATEISRLQVEFAASALSKDERRLAKKVFKAIANLSPDLQGLGKKTAEASTRKPESSKRKKRKS